MHSRTSNDSSSASAPPYGSILTLPCGRILKEMAVEERRKKKTCGAVTRKGGICKNPIITTFGICPVHVSQARGFRANSKKTPDAKKTRRKMEIQGGQILKSRPSITRTIQTETILTPSPRVSRVSRSTLAIPDATFNSLSLPTSPLTDEEIEAESFWNTPQLTLDTDDTHHGDGLDLSRILIFNET